MWKQSHEYLICKYVTARWVWKQLHVVTKICLEYVLNIRKATAIMRLCSEECKLWRNIDRDRCSSESNEGAAMVGHILVYPNKSCNQIVLQFQDRSLRSSGMLRDIKLVGSYRRFGATYQSIILIRLLDL
jgi:hypothetical protein